MNVRVDDSGRETEAAAERDLQRAEAAEAEAAARHAADLRLVAAAAAGDEAAFEKLVRQYRNDVFALSYHFVRNREEAWDIAQEVFIKAYRSLKRFRGDAAFKTWLLRIAANHCKDFLKKRRLSTVPFDEAIRADRASEHPNPADALANSELGRAIAEAVEALPIKHRTAFILREYEGLSYQEMAEVMECREGTVMSRLHHARRKLRKALIARGLAEDTRDAEG